MTEKRKALLYDIQAERRKGDVMRPQRAMGGYLRRRRRKMRLCTAPRVKR